MTDPRDRGGDASPSRPSRTFEDMALAQGLITPEQLDECRLVQKNVAAQGLECDIEEILLKKGLVTRAQTVAIHAALGRGNKAAIEGYEILSKLGAGGQGAVYKARQSSMDRLVAIKALLPKFAREKDGVQRFLREAKAVARLNHPNVVSGIDAGYSNGIYYYVMEYMDGESVERRLEREGKRPWREALSILRQMASALDHARRNGLIHRDVKPGNILLAKDGTAKLADLGMARFAGQEGMTLTQAGFAVGTPHYIAPEQARGEADIDIRADLYSLGITFYEMLAGKPPFTGTDPLVILNKHLNETVRFHFADVPAEILAIGHRLTERDRARRYASPAQLIEDIDAFDRGQALLHARSAVRPKTVRIALTPAPRRASPWPLVLAGAGAAAVVAVLAVALSRRGETPRPPEPKPPPAAAAPAPPREKPLAEADGAALAALTRARQYELANPNDVEEAAAQYAEAAAKTAGTAYAETARKRAEETRDQLIKAIEGRKAAVLAEAKAERDLGKFGAAMEALDRHARDYRDAGWKDWISGQRAGLETALAAEAKSLREASAAAEAKGDLEGSVAPMRDLAALGVPSLAREAADRIRNLEAARRAADERKARRIDADRARLEAFLARADAWAAAREYEKIEPAAPAFETEGPGEALKAHLAFYGAAREILEAAQKHLLSLQEKNTSFTTRRGQAVSGRVGAVQEQPVRLLVGEKSYDLAELSARSLAAFSRAATGAAPRPEGVASLALHDGDAPLLDETLEKSPVEMPDRARKACEELRRKAAEEARRLQEERDAAKARKEETPGPRKPDGPAREIVVHASDLPGTALGKDLESWDDPSSPGGRMIGIHNDGDPIGPPPDPDASATFKVQVQAGVPYRCWVRMKVGRSLKNSQANLLFVQFTNAVDRQGREIFTLGTRDFIAVRAPAREGWIWAGRDLPDPKSTEPVVHFRASGEVTVGITAGMEGVGFDQFVLSPARHFSKPPAEAVAAKPGK